MNEQRCDASNGSLTSGTNTRRSTSYLDTDSELARRSTVLSAPSASPEGSRAGEVRSRRRVTMVEVGAALERVHAAGAARPSRNRRSAVSDAEDVTGPTEFGPRRSAVPAPRSSVPIVWRRPGLFVDTKRPVLPSANPLGRPGAQKKTLGEPQAPSPQAGPPWRQAPRVDRHFRTPVNLTRPLQSGAGVESSPETLPQSSFATVATLRRGEQSLTLQRPQARPDRFLLRGGTGTRRGH
jgi:hypothetical protein